MPAAAIVAAGVGGALISSSAAKSAAKTQAGATNRASEMEMDMFNVSREDQAPWRERGNAAGDRLNFLLGLSPSSGAATNSMSMYNPLARDQIRAELLPSFTKTVQAQPIYDPQSDYESGRGWANGVQIPIGYTAAGSQIDEAGLTAAIESRMAAQAQSTEAMQAAQRDPQFGSLLRDFTMSDLNGDPVYQTGFQFGLDEGTKGLGRMASANGTRDSGSMLKELTRFATEYAGTKANESFNRFNTNKLNKFNMLSGVAGTGQAATNQVQAAGQTMATNVGNNMMGVGNARAASAIGQANALNGAIGQGVSAWQQQQTLNALQQPQPYYSGGAAGASWTNGFDL